MKPSFISFLVFVSFCLVISQNPVNCRHILTTRPQPDKIAAFARWLVSESTWGVLSTLSDDFKEAPFGNVVSFSDGPPNKGIGIPYFYLTTLDPTVRDAVNDPRASLTISEFPIGTCGKIDPENPTCAKITLIGKLKIVDENPIEINFARISLFTKHPEMKGCSKDQGFRIFKLEIENIFMINMFGGPKPLTVAQYRNVNI